MAQLIDLRDLLRHEILDLYSAEEQIIEALPKMIEKAGNGELKTALRDHLKVTEEQKKRLDEIKSLMGDEPLEGSDENKKGFFSRLFGGSEGTKCKGTEGLIKEGEKMMGEDMSPEVMDAAIIGAAQKIEHYEISGYGTAAAYARELGLSNVAGLLQQTLDEEYFADDALTKLAVGRLNIEAENATPAPAKGKGSPQKSSGSSNAAPKKSSSSKGSNASKSSNSSKGGSKAAAKKSSSSKGAASKAAPSKSSASSGKNNAGKSQSKSAGKSSGKGSSKGGSKSGNSKSSKRR